MASQLARQIAGGAWGRTQATLNKVMDPELAEAFAEIIDEIVAGQKPRRIRRTVYVSPTENKEIDGTFLAWGTDFEELNDCVGQFPVAIIENDDGTVCYHPAYRVKFLK